MRPTMMLLAAAALAACTPGPGAGPGGDAAVAPTECKASLLHEESTLARDVAALGRSMACMAAAPGGPTGTTLFAEGADPSGRDASRLIVIVMRSDEPLGAPANGAASNEAFVSELTGGSNSGAVLPVRVPAATTIAGHRIALRGFSMQRPADPMRYVCVAATDRTSERTLAVVCRPGGATGANDTVAQGIVTTDLPGIQW